MPPAVRVPLSPCQKKEKAVEISLDDSGTSAPCPPSPPLRDQHTVVHGYNAPCVCAPCRAYAVRAGVEPSSAALALPDRHCPAGGLCSLPVAATTYSS